jgi:hypothetical protein
MHTSRDRKRKVRLFVPSRAFDTPLTRPLKNPLITLPIPPRLSIAPQSRLRRLCSRGADSRRPKGPNAQDDGSKWLLYTSGSGRPGFLYQTGGVNS